MVIHGPVYQMLSNVINGYHGTWPKISIFEATVPWLWSSRHLWHVSQQTFRCQWQGARLGAAKLYVFGQLLELGPEVTQGSAPCRCRISGENWWVHQLILQILVGSGYSLDIIGYHWFHLVPTGSQAPKTSTQLGLQFPICIGVLHGRLEAI
jgi:hypothetical protein